ncbi:MAG: hypothetical protein Q8K89_12440 [Actinomycetota bacterium]|nr:hypothetical protein [Actinomycetota bacterium]
MRVLRVVSVAIVMILALCACTSTSVSSPRGQQPAAAPDESRTSTSTAEQVVESYVAAVLAGDESAVERMVAPGFDTPDPGHFASLTAQTPIVINQQPLDLRDAELFRSKHSTSQMERLLDPAVETVMVSVAWEVDTPGGVPFIGLVRSRPDGRWRIFEVWGAPLYQ